MAFRLQLDLPWVGTFFWPLVSKPRSCEVAFMRSSSLKSILNSANGWLNFPKKHGIYSDLRWRNGYNSPPTSEGWWSSTFAYAHGLSCMCDWIRSACTFCVDELGEWECDTRGISVLHVLFLWNKFAACDARLRTRPASILAQAWPSKWWAVSNFFQGNPTSVFHRSSGV